jgi:hypothetical protein
MRENRTCGSEGGETGQPVFPTPINLFKLFLRGRLAPVPLHDFRGTSK